MGWICLRIDFITSVFFVLLSLIFLIIFDNDAIVKMFSLTAATIGLSLSKSWQVLSTTSHLMLESCESQNNLTSLERILEYSLLPSEDNDEEKIKKFKRNVAQEKLKSILHQEKQETDEFANGDIETRDLFYSYENSEPVLRNLNVKIKSGEKIGIVGRTGAGKSSFISALFR